MMNQSQQLNAARTASSCCQLSAERRQRVTCSSLELIAVTLLLCLMIIEKVSAAGVPPGFERKPLPIYTSKPSDCYVLLKSREPYIYSSNEGVCLAVVNNFNKFCSEEPQYNLRKIHSTTSELSAPHWKDVDVQANEELVKQVFLAMTLERYRTKRWEGYGSRVLDRVKDKTLRLFESEISIDSSGDAYKAYKLENIYAAEPPGFDQPYLMFSE